MNEKELTAVTEYEAELRERLNRQHDEDMIFADLTGLYVEIIGEVSRTDKSKAGIIYDYAKLLEQELQLYSGADAYIAGRESVGKPENDILFDYLRKVANENHENRIDTRIQACFYEIAGLLGGVNGLITEFTETYRRVHGAVKDNIIEFIRMGQASGADSTGERHE